LSKLICFFVLIYQLECALYVFYIVISWLFCSFLEHRNMPVESAIGLITKTSKQIATERENSSRHPPVNQQQSNPAGVAPELIGSRGRSVSPVFQRPDENITNMLKMVINGSNLVVEELDEIIGFFQQQRDKLAAARGITLLKEAETRTQKPPLKSGAFEFNFPI
jgi:hypothetical protein